MAKDARGRLVGATLELVRERGVEGTSVADVLERSGAARGSLYQNFPDGKTGLVVAAVEAAGRHLVSLVDRATSTAEAVALLLDFWEAELERHEGRLGCPVVAASVDTHPDVRDAAARVLARLHEALTGLDADPHEAGFVLSAVEGALVRSRLERSSAPLREVRTRLAGGWDRPPDPGREALQGSIRGTAPST